MAGKLPARVALPPVELLYDASSVRSYDRQAWRYVYNTATEAGIDVTLDSKLRKVCWSAWEVEVDGIPIVIDISDYHTLDGHVCDYPLWLRFTYTHYFDAFPEVGSFPLVSFQDWDMYRAIRRDGYARRATDNIVFGVRKCEDVAGKATRRAKVHALLKDAFGPRLDDSWTHLTGYLDRARNSLAAVVVPGSCNNRIDRSTWQLMAAGVPVVCPEIFDAPLGVRPEANEHYVRCKDDYSDLIERLHMLELDRESGDRIGDRIGANAGDFFKRYGTPSAIWSYIGERLESCRET
jgi:hypothetical protein